MYSIFHKFVITSPKSVTLSTPFRRSLLCVQCKWSLFTRRAINQLFWFRCGSTVGHILGHWFECVCRMDCFWKVTSPHIYLKQLLHWWWSLNNLVPHMFTQTHFPLVVFFSFASLRARVRISSSKQPLFCHLLPPIFFMGPVSYFNLLLPPATTSKVRVRIFVRLCAHSIEKRINTPTHTSKVISADAGRWHLMFTLAHVEIRYY